MVKSALPNSNIPIGYSADGSPVFVSKEWWAYELAEHNRTGGNSTDKIADTVTTLVQAQTDIADATASGLFQVTQGSTSAGALATILLQVKTSLADPLHTASIKLSALAAGASRIELAATTISIDGTLLANGAILSTHIGTEQVGTTNIAGSAVTTSTLAAAAACAHAKEDFSGVTSVNDTSSHNLNSGLAITLTGAATELDLNVIVHNSDGGDHAIQVQILKDGSLLKAWPASGTEGFTAQHTGYTTFHFTWHDSDTGSHTYIAQWANTGATTTLTAEGTLRIDEIKR